MKETAVAMPRMTRVGVVGLTMLLLFASGRPQAAEAPNDSREAFLKILDSAYEASCGEVDRLRKYYLADAEIINDGRQVTLDETIKELKQSMVSLQGLTCGYEPRVRSTRVSGDLAYVVVRETIRLAAQEMAEQRIQQVCTYVFSRKDAQWWIAHDHCSSVQGDTA